MIKFRNFLNLRSAGSYLALAAMVVFATSCSDDDDTGVITPVPEQNVVQYIEDSDNLSSLDLALAAADLKGTLSGAGPFTIFAPSNAAFEALLASNDEWSELGDIPADVLSTVLTYHVVNGNVMSNQLSAGPVTTLQGEDIEVSTIGGILLNGSATVTSADNEASNGVVHVIDEVLLPPSIADAGDDDDDNGDEEPTIAQILIDSEDYSILLDAVVRLELDGMFDEDGDYTVFAPNNAAFEALLASNGDWNSLDDIDDATLTAVLQYHVVGMSASATDLTDLYAETRSVTTLSDETLYFSVNDDGVFLNGTTMVDNADIMASNGIIHGINAVLMPPMESIAGIASGNENFSILVAALARLDLVDTFSGEGEFTVFAPTNDAFQALLDSNDEWNTLDDISDELLRTVVTYHVIDQVYFSSDLESTNYVMLSGEEATVELEALTIQNAALNADLLNIHATNGVIHAVNDVMLPPSIQ